ncbi:MAG: 23S rRNA (uracil(1939)-C(5))-methyltransferase RlmD [Roseiflexaceae bacterium]
MPITTKLLKRQILDGVRATDTVAPRCAHAQECGGCAVQDRRYEAQLAVKRAALEQIWREALPLGLPGELELVASPSAYEYRTRMDYVASRQRFGLRHSGRFNHIIDLVECHLIPPAAFRAARAAYTRARELGLPDYDVKRHEGFLRYVVVRRSPDDQLMLAAVASSRDNAEQMEQVAAHALEQPGVVSFYWLLNDKLTDLSMGEPLRHWGAETLPMRVGQRTLRIGPNTFFQNNIHLLLPLLDDVAAQVGPAGSVADLYGGVGTIALHLAERVGRIACVEEVGESVALARANIAENGVANVSATEASTLSYLRDQPAGAFEVVVVDPPRVGLGPEVCRELLRLRPARIVYVSCNPLTQAADASILLEGYRLGSLRGYDMFPHTPHMEALGVFDQR